MHILLTNDDGVYAPGLRALRGELKKLGRVTVVAPAGEQSAVGHLDHAADAAAGAGGARRAETSRWAGRWRAGPPTASSWR